MAHTFSSQPSLPATDGALSVVSIFELSDDECFARLGDAIERHDDSKLDQLALLIGRLAVGIEL